MSSITRIVMVVVLVAVVVASLVGCSGKPQAVCSQEGNAKVGYWVALPDSVTENNPFGVCQNTVTKALVNGLRSFASYFAEVAKKVENVKQCYDSTGMGTSCLAAEVR